jgi:hypothetical protein
MPVEFVNPASQVRLSALLRYFTRGDFARFCQAVDLAYGLESTKDKYFSANLLLAVQVTGMCDVSSARGSTAWWVSHCSDIVVASRRRKEIGTSETWFNANESAVTPVAISASGAPLILGKVAESSAPGCIFDRALSDIVPAFKDIERQLLTPGTFSDSSKGNEVHKFDTTTGNWTPIEAESICGPSLVRARDQYSGWSLYVNDPGVGLRVRITQPEWAFVVAYHLLPWKIEDLFRTGGNNIELHRAVKLPALLFRTLFAAASGISIGRTVVFRDVHEQCVQGLRRYFDCGRG